MGISLSKRDRRGEPIVEGRVSNRVAIVTGAGTGVGRACAELLAAEGARVVVANRSVERGNETVRRITAAGGQAMFCRTDVTQVDDCRRVVEETIASYGRLDILVNNAAIFPRATLEETTPEFWDALMATNLRGPFLLCQAAIPHMVRGGGGSIINTGSNNGIVGAPELMAYAVTKGGLLTMTRNLARAYARDHVRVNYVIPGWIASEGELEVRGRAGQDLAWLQEQGRRQPMGRLQVPEDAAQTVLFLASDASSQITACVINTDGGSSVFQSSPRA
jgi:NAD(P)-dependent dehydrogenase (short-subunit alcohol dehydrogenase family)